MKNNRIHFFSFAVLLIVISSCTKDNFNYPPGTVGSSKIIYFPSIALKGDKITAVQQGVGYTDPGVTALLNGAATTYTTSMTISASTAPGIYNIVYTAVNAQGYSASDFRIVAVYPSTVISDPNDFSGTYLRASTGVTSTWTKIGPGTYSIENPGGATSGVGLVVIGTNYSGTTVTIPSQNSLYFGGTVSSVSLAYTVGSPSSYKLVLNAPGYGGSTRSFVKQ